MRRRIAGLLVVLGAASLLLPILLGQAPPTGQDFATLQKAAEEQAKNPDVSRYLSSSAPGIAGAVDVAKMRCIRREIYSRRSQSAVILTVDADGVVSSALVRIENRISGCTRRALDGTSLVPPPVAPLYIYVGDHFGER